MIRYPADGSILSIESLDVAPGERLIVFGPNGAGKSTMLRILAGVLPGGPAPAAAYLPQKPHLFKGSTRWNLGLGLDPEQTTRAAFLAATMGVDHLFGQPASHLSGGEIHRIALARVLARPETLVLLDEPLAPIDVSSRRDLARVVLEAISDRSAIIVTHDIEEAVALGTHMAVLIGGRIRQRDEIGSVLSHPGDADVAAAIGVGNLIEGIARVSGGVTRLEGRIEIVGSGLVVDGSSGRAVFGAEAVTLFATPLADSGSARNHWTGAITGIRSSGRMLEVTVDCGVEIVALVTPGSADGLGLAVGSQVGVAVKAASVKIL